MEEAFGVSHNSGFGDGFFFFSNSDLKPAAAGEVDCCRGIAAHKGAKAYLFDTYVPGEHGGTGKTFDWSKMPEKNIGHRVLAGGLDAENVAKAIRIALPDAVDVSSGVESQPGIKNHETLERFIAAAKQAGRELAL